MRNIFIVVNNAFLILTNYSGMSNVQKSLDTIGHAEAYDYLYEISKDKPLELADILKLHELFYRRINPEVAGKIRTGQNTDRQGFVEDAVLSGK